MKPNNGGSKFSKPMKQDIQIRIKWSEEGQV